MMNVHWAMSHLNRVMQMVNELNIDQEAKRKIMAEVHNAMVEVERERYNGWPNRETWALYTWLSNDQGLYEEVRERANTKDPVEAVRNVKDYIEALFDEFQDDPATYKGMANMVMDVGSLWRVDWAEITGAFRE